MDMTLLELAKKWKRKEVTDENLSKLSKQIKIYEPVKDDVDGSQYSNGNGNSFLEIDALAEFTREEAINFRKIVLKK